jgi:excinuclease ABC subunit A
MPAEFIRVRGAKQHNLRIPELAIPKWKLIVFTGVSGSGKSSLAFDTLYAEGQRRYVESLSAYARQFLGQMDKPIYDKITGLSPTIAIEQKTTSNNPRSTVGTITEIADYLRVLYARVGVQHCPNCDRTITPLTSQQVVKELGRVNEPVLLLAPLIENRKGEFREILHDLASKGFVRIRHNGEVVRIDALRLDKKKKHTLELIIDRLTPTTIGTDRLTDSVETALHEGNGMIVALGESPGAKPLRLSQNRACTHCGIGLPELSPQSFSFNGPVGMCPSCNGLGRRTEMDASLVVPDTNLSVRGGAIAPWAKAIERGDSWTGMMFKSLQREYGIDLDVPWKKLSRRHRDILLRGSDGKKIRMDYEGARGSGSFNMVWEGILNIMMRRFRQTRSEQMRQYYMKYFSEATCSECNGTRLRSESRAVRVGGKTIVEVSALSVRSAREYVAALALDGARAKIAAELLKEIANRLGFLEAVGLNYLTLDRSGPSLSGGEAQRIRLASQLGSDLSGVIYVLDEPSVGLHARDNIRLIKTLEKLRDAGNTVIVVEHDAQTMERSDFVVDFGPGAGHEGGTVVFAGPPRELKKHDGLTGRYLSGVDRIEVPEQRRRGTGSLTVRGARENNLKGIDVAFPLGTFTAVTGVSGAGKSSLVAGILHPALQAALHGSKTKPGAHDGIDGIGLIDKVIHIDQDPIGRTPRSNPATYTGALDLIRDFLTKLPESRIFGYKPGRFSFNVKGGRCEACRGDGVRRVEMHFLPDVYVPCEVCAGKRFNEATLCVRYKGHNIADILDLSVRQALDLFDAHPKLIHILNTLRDVGLDYVKLGQLATTLSGGEAQRVKLSKELAKRSTGRTLYILDEPTTGLHFDDIRKLLTVLDRLVDAGNTVVIIEHNMDVIKRADHVIDIGPEGGDGGGYVVALGTPEEVARSRESSTGAYLGKALHSSRRHARSRSKA